MPDNRFSDNSAYRGTLSRPVSQQNFTVTLDRGMVGDKPALDKRVVGDHTTLNREVVRDKTDNSIKRVKNIDKHQVI